MKLTVNLFVNYNLTAYVNCYNIVFVIINKYLVELSLLCKKYFQFERTST